MQEICQVRQRDHVKQELCQIHFALSELAEKSQKQTVHHWRRTDSDFKSIDLSWRLTIDENVVSSISQNAHKKNDNSFRMFSLALVAAFIFSLVDVWFCSLAGTNTNIIVYHDMRTTNVGQCTLHFAQMHSIMIMGSGLLFWKCYVIINSSCDSALENEGKYSILIKYRKL